MTDNDAHATTDADNNLRPGQVPRSFVEGYNAKSTREVLAAADPADELLPNGIPRRWVTRPH